MENLTQGRLGILQSVNMNFPYAWIGSQNLKHFIWDHYQWLITDPYIKLP